jgi:putative mRNA 3-end processing factor
LKSNILKYTKQGLYCPQADVYIDPWGKVDKAVITHGHSDHARLGPKKYLAHRITVPIIKQRLGSGINVKAVEYGEVLSVNGVKISLHPAGHIPGSAQVRMEHKGEVAVVSGDYKLVNDGFTTPFEVVKCNTFVTESTFGLPIYKWKSQKELSLDINKWWKRNKEKGFASVLCGYSLGKAQRIIYNLDKKIGKIFTHGAVQRVNELLINEGMPLPKTELVTKETPKTKFAGAMIIAPPSAMGTPWLNKFDPYSLGYASGWMNVRGAKRWQAIDIGFPVSDHADWPDLNEAIKQTGAETVYVTHGFTAVFVRWLREQGMDAYELKTRFTGEQAGDDLSSDEGGD